MDKNDLLESLQSFYNAFGEVVNTDYAWKIRFLLDDFPEEDWDKVLDSVADRIFIDSGGRF
jgi:hypothetical protein